MAEQQTDKLEQKKRELEQEIEQIQEELDLSVGGVRSDVSRSLSPDHLIRKYPLPVLGASVLVGFLLGHEGRRREGEDTRDSLSNTLFKELKQLATKKAIRFATDYIEEILEEKTLKDPSSNGSED